MLAALLALALAALVVAGCGSSSKSSSSSSSAAASSGSSSGNSGSSSGNTGTATNSTSGSSSVASLTAKVNKLAAVPQFSQYAKFYGGKVTKVSELKGKKILIVPGDTQLAACQEIAQASAALATALGMKPKIFADDGETSQYNSAIQQAISGGYSALQMECDFDPTTVAPGIAQAEAHGIKVITYGATPAEASKSKVDGDTVDPYVLDGEAAAWQAIEQHQGKPFQAIAITSDEAPATADLQQGITSQLKKYCSGCKVTDVNVPVANWTTDVSTSLSAALLKNPDVSVVFPDYAGELTYVLQGIQQAHKSGIKTYLGFGGGTPFVKLQAVSPSNAIIQSDIGGYPPWTGYLLMLQTARVMTGMSPLPISKAYGPDRIVTPQNATNVLETGGWGTSWVNGFRKLLGLPALSGTALTSASTLNGAMTAKP